MKSKEMHHSEARGWGLFIAALTVTSAQTSHDQVYSRQSNTCMSAAVNR